MKLDLWLIDRKDPGQKEKFTADLPAIPQNGDVILVGDAQNYEVSHTTFHFDEEGRFTGYITVDALSLWNRDDKT